MTTATQDITPDNQKQNHDTIYTYLSHHKM